MLCIECDEPASYIYNGKSLCKQHLDYHSDNSKVLEAQYQVLLKEYVGRVATLDYFFDATNNRYKSLTVKHKVKFLQQINSVIEKNKIDKRHIDNVLAIAVNKGIFNIAYVIATMKSLHEQELTKQKNNDKNDKVFDEVYKNAKWLNVDKKKK
jgi:hypothetical protein